MSNIENTVVSISFDNSSFEKNLADTIKSLDELKRTLDFTNAQKSIQDLGKKTSEFSVGGMTSAIEGVSKSFIALSAIGIAALTRIVNAAFDAGIAITRSLSIAPINQGFHEYETNMNSIQTILSNTDSKGTTLAQVSDALDLLNQYSDQTIYNFSEMARNIGTFTAAGVDLDTSVMGIKGIANLAAISGSNSQQASTAMYQLSQALASGTVKLMDWNSVVNAGMGGEVFQKALFETGKALGTIKDVPMDQTFDQWKDAGNSFRASLETGWITADVLTNTLAGFTGDLTEAQILSMGYTQAQATEILRLGKIGKAAATEVKTFTQLIGTVKEAVGSGWSQTFRIIFGDFNEAKTLFTGLNNSIGEFVSKSADARNAIFQGWSNMGGRTMLIWSLQKAFYALSEIVRPIREAFREIFPEKTFVDLFLLTKQFALFVQTLYPSGDTINNIRRIFTGFFGVLEIGWTILKETIGFFKELFTSITGAGSGKFLEFAATIGDFFTSLNTKLVTEGGIAKFFDNLSASSQQVIAFVNDAKDVIIDFFTNLNGEQPEFVTEALGRLEDRAKNIGDYFSKAGDFASKFAEVFSSVVDVLSNVYNAIRDWFKNLGQKIADEMGEADFDSVFDTLNVLLLGGIATLLVKFFKSGLKIDFGDGIFEKIGASLDEVTGTLKAMQTELKANALLKIAGAIALLVASVLVLSLIDSVALTAALGAMAIGFTQLMAAFAILTKMTLGPAGAAAMTLTATTIMVLAGAIFLLAIATKVLSSMSWDELSRGLTGVVVLLGALVAASILLSKHSKSLITAGVSMMFMAVALNIMAVALKIFATMSWTELAKGMASVAVGLSVIALAMQAMPKSMILTASQLIFVGVALNLIATSMLIFSSMSWTEIGKGLTGVWVSLNLIAGAMHLMPKNMAITASQLVFVGVALNLIALSMKIMSTLSWEEMAKGLLGMAGSLIILSTAANAMSGAVLGAIAIGIVGVSLIGLAYAIREFANLDLKTLGAGLLGIAITFGVLGVATKLLTPVVPTMLALGAAMLLLGAGFALIGIGAIALAKALQIIGSLTATAVVGILKLLDALISRIPSLLAEFAKGLIALAQVFIDAAPALIASLAVLVDELLKALILLIPTFAEALTVLILELLQVVRDTAPDWIETGLLLLTELLSGIRDNMAEITDTVIAIILEFLKALTDDIDDIVKAGLDLLISFLGGITDNIAKVVVAVGEVIVAFIEGVGDAAVDIIAAGAQLIVDLMQGVADNVLYVIDAGFQVVIDFLNGLADSIEKNRGELAAAGLNLLDAIFGGILEKGKDVFAWFTDLPSKIVSAIGSVFTIIWEKGIELIENIFNGITYGWVDILIWFVYLPARIVSAIPNALNILWQIGKDIITGLWNGILAAKDWLLARFKEMVGWLPGWVKDFLGISSPSKVFAEIGTHIPEGLAIGVEKTMGQVKEAMQELADTAVAGFRLDQKDINGNLTDPINEAMRSLAMELSNIEEFNPTITPVLDLTNLQRDMKAIATFVPSTTAGLALDVSYGQASIIATSQSETAFEEATAPPASEIRFEQTINSPTTLSASDIYRQTRNLVVLAKEELSIP